jgi:hypothetical protein
VTADTVPSRTVAAFGTLCGATVVLLRVDQDVFEWKCLGCGVGSHHSSVRSTARFGANGHASNCRSKPMPTGQ